MNKNDYNKGGMVAFVFAMIINVLFFFYICFIHPGVVLPEEAAAKKASQASEMKPGDVEALKKGSN